MKKFLFFIFLLFLLQPCWSQFRERPATIKYEIPQLVSAKPSTFSFFGMYADPAQTFKYQSPALTTMGNITGRDQSQSAWINSVTSQSYGNGKFGTYYYWDVQGNLQGTRGFIDISGKNKRGLKLLFPWR
jgi:hypothetical protein